MGQSVACLYLNSGDGPSKACTFHCLVFEHVSILFLISILLRPLSFSLLSTVEGEILQLVL